MNGGRKWRWTGKRLKMQEGEIETDKERSGGKDRQNMGVKRKVLKETWKMLMLQRDNGVIKVINRILLQL